MWTDNIMHFVEWQSSNIYQRNKLWKWYWHLFTWLLVQCTMICASLRYTHHGDMALYMNQNCFMTECIGIHCNQIIKNIVLCSFAFFNCLYNVEKWLCPQGDIECWETVVDKTSEFVVCTLNYCFIYVAANIFMQLVQVLINGNG